METLKATSIVLDQPVNFQYQVYAGNRMLRKYVDYEPVMVGNLLFALNLWIQLPKGTRLDVVGPFDNKVTATV